METYILCSILYQKEQKFLLCMLTSGMCPLCSFVTQTIRSQSITSQLEQSTHTEPFCLVIVSIPRTCYYTSDPRFYHGWRMPRLSITYNYPIQKLERISIYDDPTTQKTSNHKWNVFIKDRFRLVISQ